MAMLICAHEDLLLDLNYILNYWQTDRQTLLSSEGNSLCVNILHNLTKTCFGFAEFSAVD